MLVVFIRAPRPRNTTGFLLFFKLGRVFELRVYFYRLSDFIDEVSNYEMEKLY